VLLLLPTLLLTLLLPAAAAAAAVSPEFEGEAVMSLSSKEGMITYLHCTCMTITIIFVSRFTCCCRQSRV
jgi:hypothetical protein